VCRKGVIVVMEGNIRARIVAKRVDVAVRIAAEKANFEGWRA